MVKILKFFDEDPGSGMETVRIRDPGWKKVGSGIRDKHPGSASTNIPIFNIEALCETFLPLTCTWSLDYVLNNLLVGDSSSFFFYRGLSLAPKK